MCFYERKDAAIKELKRSSIRPLNYTSPIQILLWKLGLKIRPAHYNSFLCNVILMGLWFAVVWGPLMWLLEWRTMSISVPSAIGLSAIAGALFGIGMAIYYKWSARKHGLSKWEDLLGQQKIA